MWYNLSKSEFELIIRKGVYPYDYISSIDVLKQRSLPSKSEFYNKLNDSNITDEEYEFAKSIWNTFKVKTLKEYTHIYLKADVMLLADIFEKFRSQCLQIYELDPAHYYTTPGYSWDAMLKQTGAEIELITDIDQLMFIERGM